MRNWRLRTKVIAVIVVPTLTALALGGLRAAGDLDRAAEFRQTVSQVDLARNVTLVVHEMQKERDLAVAWAANRDNARTPLDAQIGIVDRAVTSAQEVASALDTDDESAKERYNIGLQRLSALGAIRETTQNTAYPDASVFNAYSRVLVDVVRLGREINTAVTDRDLLREGTVIQSLSEAKESVSQENAILQIAAVHDSYPADLLSRIRDTQAAAAGALEDYRANASLDQLQLFNDTVSGSEVDDRQRIKAQAISAAERSTADVPLPLLINAADLSNAGAATVERMRTVEIALLDQLRGEADELANAAVTSAWRDAALVVVALLLAFGLMVIVTRSLLTPLRVLRREALEVANRKLPASVQRILADPNPAEAAKHAVEPMPVFTREETGQLARSFDAVQEQAVLMATEQALLRENINSIFVNLSRRSQTLLERQLSLIDRLEQDEQDPDQLASLFELDHLATRMRRNSESLLVLSGTGLSRQLSRPVPASDVVGASVSEVEHYVRVEVASAPEVAVQGRAVSDLVHVVAELLDNATFFSEPEKKVIVRMSMTRKQELAIQITDKGVGMSEQEIAAANARLADPPDLDVAVTRRMGLYVVARLAKRHNITVRLRDNEDIEGGLVARIVVPADLIQPLGAPARSLSATATTSSLRPTAMESSLGTGSSLPSLPSAPVPARSSGIAGAFAGGIPRRLRPDGNFSRDTTRRDRSPEQATGQSANALTHDRIDVAPASSGATPDLDGRPSGPGDPATSGEYATGLFGPPLPEPSPAVANDRPPLATGRPTIDHHEDAPTERLPIYEAVLSQWFEAADSGVHPLPPDQPPTGSTTGMQGAANGSASAPEGRPEPVWTSPGDEGWQAAEALLSTGAEKRTTNAGLPKRKPKEHLMPGSAAPRNQEQTTTTGVPAAPPVPPRSPDAIRGRMSSFQQGVRRGRHTLIDAHSGDTSGAEVNRPDEEQE
ncbi:sensor histidine kinase [Actinophytocola algeriensis]|uniref:histidine kinase n=1 Tax=Actinophytocola algeriensis TaxID=1768010 RepID=A0A7W7VCD1_9PSEU|nr:nitrate- and nitrite sensing domain-containing protein [Actinophytocola algeriensis]MBB4905053.1 signal transduction histidine kinase [Actinophytocola algeriensis]MBE1476087.1 signal transduction histidine kinase [Actinophytocola algeriensis]